MADTLSLAWNAYQNNICGGLRLLQQHGEFVDMTLAADGHHVKVHQLVLSLASPYIKDLISTAQSSHPIIFLNNISYNTLSAILEYVYTGEAHIPKDSLSELLKAAKALHIKGLKELNTAEEHVAETNVKKEEQQDEEELASVSKSLVNSDDDYCNDQSMNLDETELLQPTSDPVEETVVLEPTAVPLEETFVSETIISEATPVAVVRKKTIPSPRKKRYVSTSKNEEICTSGNVQYSVSNQGNLQVIFNRYIYNLKYVQKNLNKYWRCVDYGYRKCPANIYTNVNNEVIQRRSDHNHTFHDQKIMKKLRLKVIFGAFHEAEDRVLHRKEEEKNELIHSSQSQDCDKEDQLE